MLVTIIVFILILSILVLVHEAGHFVVAKLLKIKVEEFGFGLPPRAFGFKFGETLYSINWLPIGGFVKLYGEDEAGGGRVSLPKDKKDKPDSISGSFFAMEEKEIEINSSGSKIEEKEIKIEEIEVFDKRIKKGDVDRAYFSRPIWQRALVIVAGVVMNFILAVTIISFLFSVVGVPVPEKVITTGVEKGSPAQKSGLQAGDTITAINDLKIVDGETLVNYTKAHLGKELTLKVITRSNKEESIKITPRTKYNSQKEGAMGISLETKTTIKKYPWYEAPFVGTQEALKETGMIVNGLVMLLMQLVTRGAVPSDVAGPVGIAQLTGTVIGIGPYAVLSFISLLSLNLAIINILPVPALDGGRLLFIVIEAVTRRKVNPVVESYAHTIGMAILLALIALITIHDLLRVLSGQPILPQIK